MSAPPVTDTRSSSESGSLEAKEKKFESYVKPTRVASGRLRRLIDYSANVLRNTTILVKKQQIRV